MPRIFRKKSQGEALPILEDELEIKVPELPEPYDDKLALENIPDDFAMASELRDKINADSNLNEDQKKALVKELIGRWAIKQASK